MSKIEIQYIRDNAHIMKYTEIAKKLERDPEAIKRWIEKNLDYKTRLSEKGMPVQHASSSCREKSFWSTLKQQFEEHELDAFEYHWNQIYTQFKKDDILPTEELQIVDLIKYQIMMDRNLIEQQKILSYIRKLNEDIDKEKQLGDNADKGEINLLEAQVLAYQSSGNSLSKEYRDMQDKKDKLFNSLKATRADRVKKVESSRESFGAWMAEIVNDSEKRRALGKEIERFRLSMIDEKVRLAAYHKYEDGNIDQPLLNHQTVKQDNE